MTAVSQPSGTVTLVFSDIEGSTKLLETLGTDAYREALAEHRRVVRKACSRYTGYEVDYEGDAFFYAFPSAQKAVSAVSEAMAGLEAGPIRIRVGIHTGTPALDPPKYVGLDVHLAARVMSAAHGGQVVVSAATAQLVSAELRELGEHRLKDIAAAVPLYQLGDGSFPPLKTISNTNLPRPASSFVGREAELTEVLAKIEQGARLLTLTGPGGSGKTRLALEAAATLVSEYKAGVFWVGLASLRDPTLVTETIAQTLGAKDGLASHIEERELLLLLDNLEQVIDAAPELSRLLESCPHLTLLVTSRELLRVSGEVEYPVPPLAKLEAIELFCVRSRLDPSPEIAELCARLDALPLAVELAAARCKVLSPKQLLERLSRRLDMLKGDRDADPRQQTLRATIEWSYDLLPEHEQRLFARLSVFAGGCTLEAAEEVGEAELDALESLLDKSLVRRMDSESGPRFWMLETIRDFAAERLEESDDAETTKLQYLRHFTSFAEEIDAELKSSDAATMIALLELDVENFRAAFAYAEAVGAREEMLALATDLWFFWHWTGRNNEGGAWLDASLADPDIGSPPVRARAFNRAAVFASERGDRALGRELNERSLVLARTAGDRETEATALHDLAGSYAEAGMLEEGAQRYEAALALFEQIGDDSGVVIATTNSGMAYRRLGHLEEARERHVDAVRRGRTLRNDHFLAIALTELGLTELEASGPDVAGPVLGEALRVAFEGGALGQVPWILWWLAVASARAGAPERAARLAGAADRSLRESGKELDAFDAAFVEEGVKLARAQLDDRRFEGARAEGAAMPVDELVGDLLQRFDLSAEARA